MKKILTLLLALCLVFGMVSCAPTSMSHEDFMAAADGDEVTIEAYVQAKQGWWYKLRLWCYAERQALR